MPRREVAERMHFGIPAGPVPRLAPMPGAPMTIAARRMENEETVSGLPGHVRACVDGDELPAARPPVARRERRRARDRLAELESHPGGGEDGADGARTVVADARVAAGAAVGRPGVSVPAAPNVGKPF